MTDLEKLLTEVTPGKWRVEDRTTLVWGDCNQDDTSTYGMGYPIAEARRTPPASWANGPKNYEEAEANARLIAMAPALARKVIAAEKLVCVLNEVMPSIEDHCWDGPEQRIKAALKSWGASQ